MTRINTNVSSLIAQNVLGRNNKSLGVALERLSTGLRINRGKDDPAGLIASEALRSEKAGLNAAISNADRSEQVVNIAEGGLQEVSNLLVELQGLITTSANAAGLSQEEKEANQLQIDSILQTIDRVSGATEFQGSKLLNGNFDYQTTAIAAGVTDFEVRGAKLDGSTDLAVNAIITQSAQQGGLLLSFGGGIIDLTDATDQFVFEISGDKGSREFQFASGATLAQVTAAVNSFKDVTGVSAAVIGSSGIKLASVDFGSNEFVSVTIVDDGNIAAGDGIIEYATSDFDVASAGTAVAFTDAGASNGIRDEGQNIAGSINGLRGVGVGKSLSVNSDFLDVEFTLNTATAQALGSVAALTITGGGADFQLAAEVSIAGKVSLGIGDLSARKLGESSLGFLDDLAAGKSFNVVDGNNLDTAQQIIDKAINQVSSTRGRLGAFQKNVVGATQRSLSTALENITA
ncbi:MAG: flagellin, partial [Phycisphaerales bacterium]|nr:flagellin [Phycisphaerales bacterium]